VFGLSQEDMARIARGTPKRVRRVRVTRVVPILLLALLGCVPIVVVWTLNRPSQIQSWIDRFSGDADFRLRIEDVVFLPVGTWMCLWPPS